METLARGILHALFLLLLLPAVSCMSPTDSMVKPASLSLDTAVLTFGFSTDSLTFSIANDGDDQLKWTIEAGDNSSWLSMDKLNGTDDSVVTVSIDRTWIPEGVSSAVITVRSNGGDATVTIHVTITPTGEVIIEGEIPLQEVQ